MMMNAEREANARGHVAAWILIGGVLLMAAFWVMARVVDGSAVRIGLLLSQTLVISLVIWQACDPFAEAAQWIGRRLHIPGSVRGATLDAVASSMPELFTGIFFVLVAVYGSGAARSDLATVGSDGYGPTVATCAGSAIYNMILIPAVCTLAISYVRKSRPTIDVARAVILRDGLWFLGCEMLLILFLFQAELTWWMAIVLLGLYVGYVAVLAVDAWRFRRGVRTVERAMPGVGHDATAQDIAATLESAGILANKELVAAVHARVRDRAERGADTNNGDHEPNGRTETADVFFGLIEVPLGVVTCWILIIVTTCVAAAACYWLVEVTRSMSEELGVPLFFVAVILAAAASSVPDTFLSLGAARRGDDDGAVANAFGSNIFDICVCLSIPLLVVTGLNDWQPITLTQNGRPMPGLVGICVLLAVLTVITLLIMWQNRQLTRRKALVLCGLYALFVLYAMAGSLGYTFGGWLS